MADIRELSEIANRLRMDVVEAVYTVQSGHIGGSLSCADLIAALYFYKMRIDPKSPRWKERDRFVLSKGHAAPILYAALARRNFFELSELKRLRQVDSFLQGASSLMTPGIDMSSGPLGQGLSAAVGIACGLRYQEIGAKVYVLLGDGEMQEGEVWEGMMAAAKFELTNLVCILDNNRFQMNGSNEDIMPIGNPTEKAAAFGWTVQEINGHDMRDIVDVLDWENKTGKPLFVVAHTVKGKGVSFMENTHIWHGKAPDQEQYKRAIQELGGGGV